MDKPKEMILAERIAEELFTSGNGEKAEFLKLYKDNRYLCGWAQKPATDRIAMVIRRVFEE